MKSACATKQLQLSHTTSTKVNRWLERNRRTVYKCMSSFTSVCSIVEFRALIVHEWQALSVGMFIHEWQALKAALTLLMRFGMKQDNLNEID